MQPRHRFSHAAPHYAEHINVQKQAAIWVMHHAQKWLLPIMDSTDILLDAGCGTGVLAAFPSPSLTIALDNAEGMCHHAASYYDAVLCADIHALPVADNAIGGMISSLCWQWANPLSAAIAELHRVMRCGGRAVITMLTDGTMHELAESYAALQLPARLLPFIAPATLFQQLKDAGFTILTSETVIQPYFHPTCWDFFSQLKAIGAHHTTRHAALSVKELKLLMRYYDTHYRTEHGVQVTYATTGFVIEKL